MERLGLLILLCSVALSKAAPAGQGERDEPHPPSSGHQAILPVSASLFELAKILIECGIDSSHTVTVCGLDPSAPERAQARYAEHPDIPFPITRITQPSVDKGDDFPSILISPRTEGPMHLRLRIGAKYERSFEHYDEERYEVSRGILNGDFQRFIETDTAGERIGVKIDLSDEARAFAANESHRVLPEERNARNLLLARMGYFEAVSRVSYYFKTDELRVRKIEYGVRRAEARDQINLLLTPAVYYSPQMNPLKFAAYFYHQLYLISSRIKGPKDAEWVEASTRFKQKAPALPSFEVPVDELEWTRAHQTTAAHFRKDLEDFQRRSRRLNQKVIRSMKQRPAEKISLTARPIFRCQSVFGPVLLEGYSR